MFTLPARDGLPDASHSTEHEDLQEAWRTFIKECESATEVKPATAGAKSEMSAFTAQVRLHVQASEDTIKRYVEGYASDKDFAFLGNHARKEGMQEDKFRAYHWSDNGLLYFEDADLKKRLCIPSNERQEVLKEVHDEAHESAHAGWERTLALLCDRFYWPSMHKDVTSYVQMCDPCQKIKHDRGAGKGFLQPLDIPMRPFDTISLDFVTGLPKSQGKNAALVIIDKLTKFAHFLPMTMTITASDMAVLIFG